MRIRWEVGGRIPALTKEESNNQQGIWHATSRFLHWDSQFWHMICAKQNLSWEFYAQHSGPPTGIHTCLFSKVTSSTKAYMSVAQKAAIVASSGEIVVSSSHKCWLRWLCCHSDRKSLNITELINTSVSNITSEALIQSINLLSPSVHYLYK